MLGAGGLACLKLGSGRNRKWTVKVGLFGMGNMASIS